MKYFLALAFFALVAISFAEYKVPEDQMKKHAQYIQACKQKVTGITDEEVNNLHIDVVNPSDAQKCLAHCILEESGSLKDDVLQKDIIMQKMAPIFGEEKAKVMLDKCSILKGENSCDTGYKMYQCYEMAQQGKLSLN